jgi:hypothetical protein
MSISFDWDEIEEIEFTFFWLMTNEEPPMSEDDIFYDEHPEARPRPRTGKLDDWSEDDFFYGFCLDGFAHDYNMLQNHRCERTCFYCRERVFYGRGRLSGEQLGGG